MPTTGAPLLQISLFTSRGNNLRAGEGRGVWGSISGGGGGTGGGSGGIILAGLLR